MKNDAPVYVQVDPSINLSNYRTYWWVEAKISDQDNAAAPTAYIDLCVRNRAKQELAKSGWKEDVEIGYDTYQVPVKEDTLIITLN